MRDLAYIIYHEAKFIFHDKGILIFIIFVPLAYPLLYSYVYDNEVVRDVPLAVVDDDNSQLSRDLVRRIDGTPDVKRAWKCKNMEEAKQHLMDHSAYGILHIPSTFSRDIWRGEQTTIGLYSDMSSMLYYKALLLGTTDSYLDMNRDIKVERDLASSSVSRRDEEITKMPVEYERVSFFNPKGGFAAFLIPPVLMLILQQTLLLGIGMQMGVTRERYGNIIPNDVHYHNPWHVLLGRAFVYFGIYFVMAVYAFTYVTNLFDLPCCGNYFTLLGFIFPFLFACIFFAMTMSTLVYRREDCILIFVFLSVPLLFLSGISWPTPSMPKSLRFLSFFFPSTFGMNGYVSIMGMGATLSDIKGDIIALWIQALVYFSISASYHYFQFKNRKGQEIKQSLSV
jgi:ABC-2 type transport system permease protein